MLKKTKIAAVLSVLAASPALAGGAVTGMASYGAQPAFDWTGPYGGMSVGKVKQDNPDGDDTAVNMHLGYLKDLGTVVLGAELGLSPIGITLDDDHSEMKTSVSLTGRLGYDMGRVLPYATLGVKHAKAEIAGESLSDSGLVYGIGADIAVEDHVLIGAVLTRTELDDFDGTGADIEQTSIAAKFSIRF